MLVELSVVEQRYHAVMEVPSAGAPVVEVAARYGVSRKTVHAWVRRYRDDGLAGLVDQSRRPDTSPRQTSVEVERLICEMRREHPRWGAHRIAHELTLVPGIGAVPSRATVHRVLLRHGLVQPRPRRRDRASYRR